MQLFINYPISFASTWCRRDANESRPPFPISCSLFIQSTLPSLRAPAKTAWRFFRLVWFDAILRTLPLRFLVTGYRVCSDHGAGSLDRRESGRHVGTPVNLRRPAVVDLLTRRIKPNCNARHRTWKPSDTWCECATNERSDALTAPEFMRRCCFHPRDNLSAHSRTCNSSSEPFSHEYKILGSRQRRLAFLAELWANRALKFWNCVGVSDTGYC